MVGAQADAVEDDLVEVDPRVLPRDAEAHVVVRVRRTDAQLRFAAGQFATVGQHVADRSVVDAEQLPTRTHAGRVGRGARAYVGDAGRRDAFGQGLATADDDVRHDGAV